MVPVSGKINKQTSADGSLNQCLVKDHQTSDSFLTRYKNLPSDFEDDDDWSFYYKTNQKTKNNINQESFSDDFVDIVSKEFTCTTDNYTKDSNTLSKHQRRRINKNLR